MKSAKPPTVIDTPYTAPRIDPPISYGAVKPFPIVREEVEITAQYALELFNSAGAAYESCMIELSSLINQDKERREKLSGK